MRRAFAAVFRVWILVHMVDEREVAINMEAVQSIAIPGQLVTDKSHCLITFNNGKFINTRETCREVGILWQREDSKVK